MTKTVLLSAVLLLSMGGCLPEETPCTYSRTLSSLLSSSEWIVDEFHVSVYDPVSLYAHDTIYLNDGTFRFIPDELVCTTDYYGPGGTIVFRRANGSVNEMRFQFISHYSHLNNKLRIESTADFDGFPRRYNIFMENYVSDDFISIYKPQGVGAYENWNPNLGYVRYWEFRLRRKL